MIKKYDESVQCKVHRKSMKGTYNRTIKEGQVR